MNRFTLSQNAFLLLLGLVTLAFLWILLPFSGALFWGIVLAIVFAPMHRRILALSGNRRNLAAFIALTVVFLLLIIPVAILSVSVLEEAARLFAAANAQPVDVNAMFEKAIARLPTWAVAFLERHEAAITSTLNDKFTAGISQVSKLAAQYTMVLSRNAFDFVVGATVMLYLLFFLFRDGRTLASQVRRAVPLGSPYKAHLFEKFVTVIRATVKGNVLVALAQGALGGIIFWFLDVPGPVLWGAVMAFLSLLPAVGAAIVWGPVAAYFLLYGPVWQGVLLGLYGLLVIGLVDNLLRPILVGKDTKLPDYIVLFSTIGGMALLGLNGFVIGPLIAALFMTAWSLFSESVEFRIE